ncbi:MULTISPECIES: histidine kinase dimerization/phosphoacceptor domain -containing protein [unclassified Methanosarcina]|uniref:histidine kinase dimerization/phosphoacceptor domain -containing protein n=1 Tax=unclassified Methanosarcina TaxID=2644672 RepID=UPI000615A1EF|nr:MULTISPECIES: histidine kinase dimerization/phosphoacceptor domain -containing protein [unclassified Methanosarcina]AKB18546.1 sensory transduction histidine kinase [Methanosarcina sp. WWM596]AKB21889.1 sensory transduction histidine kinase [Methanosarcina sp. WH1]
MFSDTPLKTKMILYTVLGVFLILTASTAVIISTVTTQEEKLAYQQSVEMASNYANQFDTDMKANLAIARTISTTMASYETADRNEALLILENLLLDNPHLLGTYVAFEPDAFDGKDAEYVNAPAHDGTGRFVPYWNKMNGTIAVAPLLHYDDSDYYQLPKDTKKDLLTEPYFYEGVFMVSYVSPIIKGGEFAGIGGVDVSLEYVDEVVSEVRTFDTGYAFMVSNEGILMSHPTHKDWIGKKNLYDFGGEELKKASIDIEKGVGGHLETTDPTTGKTVIMFYEPVKTGDFAFVLVVPKEEMLAGVTDLRDKLLIISAISILFMAALAYMIARSVTKPINRIVDNFKSIAEDAVKGELGVRADTNVGIDFREIPRGLNEILNAVVVPIRETMRVTNALAQGELKERVNVDVQGEFRKLEDTLDKFSETLNMIIDDSNAVLTAFQHNNFKLPIRIQGQGDFKLLTDGIEETRLVLDRITTQRREAEKALIEYARKLEHSNRLKEEMERIINNSPVIVILWKYEEGWPIEFVSENVTLLGYEVEDLISNRILYADIVYPDDLEKVDNELARNVDVGCDAYNSEYRIFTKSGEVRWVDERTFIQRDGKGEIRLQGIILDITEHKKAEEALLQMEEIRKKEIHHRIKNNLQVISTLLYLESGNFSDEKVIEAFKDSQHRVKSMALVHEKLYQSEDMISVDFADYIQNLANYLFGAYSVGSRDIKLKLDVDNVFLGMDTAVPLGIIINELISNSLKHAFSEGESGEICVGLKKEENGKDGKETGRLGTGKGSKAGIPGNCFSLIVRDNGKGFPEDIDFKETDSLGLQLVVSLVDQVEGSIELDTSRGTEFRIMFRELKYKQKL